MWTELHQFTFSIELASGEIFEGVSDGALVSSVDENSNRILANKPSEQVKGCPEEGFTKLNNSNFVLRTATLADVPLLDRWDRQPHVISATTDDPAATKAFESALWPEELVAQDKHSRYFIAEFDSRAIGAMQIIDPHLETTHYWGEIEPNLRAIDIWIGEADCLGKGYGEIMMRRAFQICFNNPSVTAIVIDPLASNTRAHKFYRRLGFKPLGRRKFDDDDCLVHELKREDWLKHFAQDAKDDSVDMSLFF